MRFDSARADRITAAVFFALGAAMLWGGYVMDRLEIRQIHPASIPGLVPMILGGVMMVCAVLLYLGTRGRVSGLGTEEPEDAGAERPPEGSWEHLLVAAGLSVAYALGLVGQMPFAVATALYLAAFVGWFLWRDVRPDRAWPTAIGVVVFSILTAAAIAALFRYGFLVRLP